MPHSKPPRRQSAKAARFNALATALPLAGAGGRVIPLPLEVMEALTAARSALAQAIEMEAQADEAIAALRIEMLGHQANRAKAREIQADLHLVLRRAGRTIQQASAST